MTRGFPPSAPRPGPILPRETASLRSLTATMAVMCYLACLALGALVLINRAAAQWTEGLSREMTVQVMEVDGRDAAADLADVLKLLSGEPGVVQAEDLGEAAGRKLLEPWLGNGDLAGLPVPRLIRVVTDPSQPIDVQALQERLTALSPGVVLDTHQRWADDLRRMALTLEVLALGVLALIAGSAVAVVVMATRAVLEANRQTVDVLHLVGASDGFVVKTVNRRFLATGLWSGGVGMALALGTFYLLREAGLHSSAGISLVNLPAANWISFPLAILAVPLFATLLALATSRLTLMRMLKVQR
jgi:cell division transport system permease protein